MNDIPAFNSESFITSINDYIMKIDFQLAKIYYRSGSKKEIMTTWTELIETLNKDSEFGKFILKKKQNQTIQVC